MEQEFIYFVISGFVLMILPILFIGGVWLRGFFTSYLKVKASAGRLVLVRVRSKLRDYYVPGDIVDGSLKFKSSNKNGRTLTLPEFPCIYKSFNVNCVDVDEEKNAIFMLDSKGVSGYDAEKVDDLILRALMKPALNNKKLLVIIVLLVFTMVGVLVVAGLQFQTYKVIQTLAAAKAPSIGGFA